MATFFGRRSATCRAHSGGALLCVITARAPWINTVRSYGSPRLLMPSSRTRPPVPLCRGTRPSQATNSRPDLNTCASPIVASVQLKYTLCDINTDHSTIHLGLSGCLCRS